MLFLKLLGPEMFRWDALTQLNAKWDRINRMYNDRRAVCAN